MAVITAVHARRFEFRSNPTVEVEFSNGAFARAAVGHHGEWEAIEASDGDKSVYLAKRRSNQICCEEISEEIIGIDAADRWRTVMQPRLLWLAPARQIALTILMFLWPSLRQPQVADLPHKYLGGPNATCFPFPPVGISAVVLAGSMLTFRSSRCSIGFENCSDALRADDLSLRP